MLRIGEFARLGGVTVRALRHYESEHLLAPARVDRETGYRFYGYEQLAALDRILALRSRVPWVGALATPRTSEILSARSASIC